MVIISEQIAGPIIKIGAGFSGILFSFPNEIAYCFLKSKVNQSAPSIKYGIKADSTASQLIEVNNFVIFVVFKSLDKTILEK